ncbi:pilus assembly PilX family protein [Marinobacter maritimus]|uniref:pilus assembly PilX family protein n=1 Tax=Marinobacter maritimus TaxID=277961 RepID=UPI0011A6826A|nr:PilX N-terminal domain-containing pilus assembly protein [Marinobacter maritimus]|tara:strand:+ start:271 stop:789 length:519 start_codon:yes stop_codon:yes gene_type:complete
MQLENSTVKPAALICSVGVRQRGAALIISLVILLVITVIGLASMNTSILQERMSANAQNARQAFLSAEAASQDLFRKLEPMDSSSNEWKLALDALDAGIRVATTPKAYSGVGSGKVATAELRYLGEANLVEGHSFGEDIETFRQRYEIIGDASVTGAGASSRVIRGVSVVFY